MRTFALIGESLRPKQWMKNLFIFAGILFSGNIVVPALLMKVLFAFFIFCLLSGCVYVINDLVDVEQDRRHPVKSGRPIASGRLAAGRAIWAPAVLVPVSLVLSYGLGTPFLLVALAYVLLEMAYCFALRRIVILDVLAVACGFVLRAAAGAVVIGVEISSWLLICASLLALFLALSKRRHELFLLGDEAQAHREVLAEYGSQLLDQMIAVVTASTVLAYALYTMSEQTVSRFGTRNLILTTPFVLYGIFRYQYLVYRKGAGGNPETILIADKPLLIAVFLWAVTVTIILYGN